eukprot:1620234-Prorocentrum_lima.AAC.1
MDCISEKRQSSGNLWDVWCAVCPTCGHHCGTLCRASVTDDLCHACEQVGSPLDMAIELVDGTC